MKKIGIVLCAAFVASLLFTMANGQAIAPRPGVIGPYKLQSSAVAAGNGSVIKVDGRSLAGVITVSAWPTPVGTATATATPTFATCSVQWEGTDDATYTGTWAPIGSAVTIGSVGAGAKAVAAVTPVPSYVRARIVGTPNTGLTLSVSAILSR